MERDGDRQIGKCEYLGGGKCGSGKEQVERGGVYMYQGEGCQGGYGFCIFIMCIVYLQVRSNSQYNCSIVKGKKGDRMVKMVYLFLVLVGSRNRMGIYRVLIVIFKVFGVGYERIWFLEVYLNFEYCKYNVIYKVQVRVLYD